MDTPPDRFLCGPAGAWRVCSRFDEIHPAYLSAVQIQTFAEGSLAALGIVDDAHRRDARARLEAELSGDRVQRNDYYEDMRADPASILGSIMRLFYVPRTYNAKAAFTHMLEYIGARPPSAFVASERMREVAPAGLRERTSIENIVGLMLCLSPIHRDLMEHWVRQGFTLPCVFMR